MLGLSDTLSDFLPSCSQEDRNLLSEFYPGKPSLFVSHPESVHRVKSWRKTEITSSVPTPISQSVWWPVTDSPPVVQPTVSEESRFSLHLDSESWANLRQDDWQDRTESELLLSLYRSTGGRWPVIYDRWSSDPVYGTKGRSLESLKSRFEKMANKLIAADVPRLAYNEQYDLQRRNFLENAYGKDPSVIENLSKIARDLFRSRPRPKPRTELNPPGRVGVGLAGRMPELSAGEAEKVRIVAESLGINLAGRARTVRVQKILSSIAKQLHSLVLLKESISAKISELDALGGSALSTLQNSTSPVIAPGGGLRLKFVQPLPKTLAPPPRKRKPDE